MSKIKIKARTLQRLYVAVSMLQSTAYKQLYTLKDNDLPSYESAIDKHSGEIDNIFDQLRSRS